MESGTPRATSHLFVYGTLLSSRVLERVIGCALPKRTAVVSGYARYRVRDASYPGAVPELGATIRGALYESVDAQALRRLDDFEGTLYTRLLVSVEPTDGGRADAWLYVVRDEYRDTLASEPWDADSFLRHDVESFLESMGRGED